MARRYSCLPSDLIHLSAEDFQFNLMVAGYGVEEEEKQARKAQRSAKARRLR